MANHNFTPIRPGGIDYIQFNFEGAISGIGHITSINWTIAVSPDSIGTDPTPMARLVGGQFFNNTRTWAEVGNCLDGVIYTITAEVTLSDGRKLIDDGDLECIARPLAPVPVEPPAPVLTPEQFRAEFPAFKNTSFYPTEQVAFWITQALDFTPLNPNRWGQLYDLGLRYYVAHNLALERMAARAAASGGAPIGASVPQSKSVNGVSISYDVEMGSEQNAGNYNLTIYGTRFLRMLRMAGSAPTQI